MILFDCRGMIATGILLTVVVLIINVGFVVDMVVDAGITNGGWYFLVAVGLLLYFIIIGYLVSTSVIIHTYYSETCLERPP